MEEVISPATLITTALGSVLVLLFLVMKARMHAFVALMIVSMCAGIFAGMPLLEVVATMQKGMAGTLGFLAIVVALGSMFGKILQETGTLDTIAFYLVNKFGQSKAHFAIGFAALICALPLFFDVAIVLLIGMASAIAKRAGTNLTKMAIPLFAGVASAAAYLLPGPTPMLLASQLGADYGWMIFIGLTAAIPAMIIAGPIFGNFIAKRIEIPVPDNETQVATSSNLPDLKISMLLILFPLILVSLNTILSKFIQNENIVAFLQFIGHPFFAILAALLIAIYGFAIPRGFSKDRIMDICSAAVQPAGIILLVTGAGGVFKQILVDSKVGPALGQMLIDLGLPIAIACFVLAACVRVIQGSATVACLTTIGLVLPILNTLNLAGSQFAALAVCIAGGSIILSHVNDSGFWLFGKFTGATEMQTLKTWTIMETIAGTIGGLIGVLWFAIL